MEEEHESNHQEAQSQTGVDNVGPRDTSSRPAPLGDTGTTPRDDSQSLAKSNALNNEQRQGSVTSTDIKGVNDPWGNLRNVPQESSEEKKTTKTLVGASALRCDPNSMLAPPNRCGEPLITVTPKNAFNFLTGIARVVGGLVVFLTPEPLSKARAALTAGSVLSGARDLAQTMTEVMIDRPSQRVSEEVRCLELEQFRQLPELRSGIRIQ